MKMTITEAAPNEPWQQPKQKGQRRPRRPDLPATRARGQQDRDALAALSPEQPMTLAEVVRLLGYADNSTLHQGIKAGRLEARLVTTPQLSWYEVTPRALLAWIDSRPLGARRTGRFARGAKQTAAPAPPH